MTAEEPSRSTSFLTLALWANGGGTAHTFQTYRAWLKKIACIPDLITPTGKFNVYNTVHDIY